MHVETGSSHDLNVHQIACGLAEQDLVYITDDDDYACFECQREFYRFHSFLRHVETGTCGVLDEVIREAYDAL